ncbi:hypothetical protein ACHAWF_006471 [Thalassiosira exigua]
MIATTGPLLLRGVVRPRRCGGPPPPLLLAAAVAPRGLGARGEGGGGGVARGRVGGGGAAVARPPGGGRPSSSPSSSPPSSPLPAVQFRRRSSDRCGGPQRRRFDAFVPPPPTSSSRSFGSSPPSPPPPPPRKPKKITPLTLAAKKRRGQKIAMVTAYDYPSAVHVDRAGIDVVLCGDSVAMVELGFETTQPVTLDEMLHHCRAVKRGAPSRPLLVGDMPFGSYEYADVDVALRNAYRMVKEGGMEAVKLEGGSESRARIARHVVEGGVAVLGHVGLLPQSVSVLGGFRAQGKTASRALALLDDALRLQDAGCFAVVLECVPPNVASAITDALEVPTIGIGAGPHTSGQVLVFHDLLGMLSHPHHEEFVPRFCKKYASVGVEIHEGLARFREEVEGGAFPGREHSPYVMSEEEEAKFDAMVAGRGEGGGAGSSSEGDETSASKEEEGKGAPSEELSLYGNKRGDR